MKLTSIGPEGARNLLREKQRRNRLAAKELRVQFPQFATIRVDLVFNDEVSQPPAPQSIVLHPPARAYFVYPCPYASCTGELDQSFAAAGQFITLLDFVFFVCDEIRRLDFGDLMSKQIQFLFAGGFRRIERRVFGEQCL